MAALEETTVNPSGAPELDETTAPPPRPVYDPLATRVSADAPWASPVSSDSDSGDPPRIARFLVLREIGRGAMGVVYAGYDDELDRRVALKLVHTSNHDDPSLGRNQLLREAQALARLAHPNVVAVHEAGVFEGSVYIAMEFIDGVDLQRWLAAAPRSWREVVATLRQAGEGLRAAHQVGLVHRDFKPSNVLVGADGRVRVADFGLATRRSGTGSSGHAPSDISLERPSAVATLAGSGALIGTPAYMAPEQLRREPATAASDQFAFCVALHEALYGKRPFLGDSIDVLAEQVLFHDPPPPPPGSAVPTWLHALLLRGLARDPTRRFPGMDALLELLARDPDAERERRRQRILQIAAAVAATVLVVFGGLHTYRAIVQSNHERRAEARLEVLRDQLAELTARGQTDEAARLVQTFADLPDNRGTAALARAFREWGESQTDDLAAIDAHAGAYIAARTHEDQAAALRSLALRLAHSGALAESAAALAALDARAPDLADDPELAALRVASALDRRDLPAARLALDRLPADDLTRTYGHALKSMSHGTWIDRATIGQRPAAHFSFSPGDIDGDGRPELVTHADQRDAVVVLRTDPALTKIAELPLPGLITIARPISPALAGVPLILAGVGNPDAAGDAFVRHGLYPLTGGPPLHVWDDSQALDWALADLDRDGASELYVGTGPYARRLSQVQRDAAGSWVTRPAHPPTNAAVSDILALAAGDLDGDGAPELVVAAGPWSAYDVRVLRADASGQLRLVARRTFGCVEDIALLRGRGDTLIALAKVDEYENPSRFSVAAPFGDPAGIYILALVGDSLEVRQHIPALAAPRPNFRAVTAADLDGDGDDDLVAVSHDGSTLLRRHDDRLLDPQLLPGVQPLAAAQFDADPETELMVRLDGDPDRYLILGLGDVPVPARAASVPEIRPIRDDLDDPAIVDAWRHAEELAAIGLPRRSAAEIATIARLAGHAHEDMLLRSAELHAAAGDHPAAAALFLAAADRPDLADVALAGAIRSRRALAEFPAAEALAARRAALPGLDIAVRGAAEAELASLRRACADRPELGLRFDRPLDPAWRIVDPLAVARDPGTDALSLQTSYDKVVADYPLEWDGGTAALIVDVAFDHLDWGSELAIGVGPAGAEDHDWLGIRFEASGRSEEPQRMALAATAPGGPYYPMLTGPPSFTGRFRLAVRNYPELGVLLAELERDGQPLIRQLLSSKFSAPAPGPMRLRLRSTPFNPDLVSHVQIFAIDLVGLRPGAAIRDDDPWRDIARKIAENEIEASLAALGDAPPGSPQALWRVDLLARGARLDDAATALRGALAGLAPDHPLHIRLRQRLMRDPDAMHLAARRALGPALYDIFVDLARPVATWRPARVAYHLADLADLAPTPPPARAGPDAHRHHRNALLLRGLAWGRAGRHDLAARDLEALVPLLGDPDLAPIRGHVLRRLIDAGVRLRDPTRLRRWVTVALGESTTADIMLEGLRKRPGIDGLLTSADWTRFEALIRR